MKQKKKVFLRILMLLLSIGSIHASHEIYTIPTTTAIRRVVSLRNPRTISSCHFNLSSDHFRTMRWHSNSQNNDQEELPLMDFSEDNRSLSQRHTSYKDALDKIKRCKSFLLHGIQLLQETTDIVSKILSSCNSQEYPLEVNNSAYDNSSQQNFLHDDIQKSPINTLSNSKEISWKGSLIREILSGQSDESKESKAETSNNPLDSFHFSRDSRRQYFPSSTQEDNLEPINHQELKDFSEEMIHQHYSPQTKTKKWADFVTMVMRQAKEPHKINRQKLKDILDLYSALPAFAEDAITKVLTGETDTGKSNVYRVVLQHVKKTQLSNLQAYRDTYKRLCVAFGKDVLQGVKQACNEIVTRKKQEILYHLRRLDTEDNTYQYYTNLIVDGAYPLYPLHSNEVEDIVSLFFTLEQFPKDKIIMVLTSETNTEKSNVYRAVLQHTKTLQGLENYRQIYSKLSQALLGQAQSVINKMIEIKISREMNQTFLSNPLHLPSSLQSDPLESNSEIITNHFVNQYNNVNPAESRQDIKMNLSQSHTTSSFDNEIRQTRDGKYCITRREQARLNRLYALLPEHHGGSITGVISGTTVNSKLPIWNSVHNAISQIKQEAIQEGDQTLIDLSYFRKLHWASVRVKSAGVGWKKKDFSEDSKIILHKASDTTQNKELPTKGKVTTSSNLKTIIKKKQQIKKDKKSRLCREKEKR